MPVFNKNTLLNERGVQMDSVNKDVIQVRNSILGFVVILQISQQIACWDPICRLLKAGRATPAYFPTSGLFLKFEITFFCMNSGTRIPELKQMMYPPNCYK